MTLLSLSAYAAPFTMDFTGIADGALVNDYYNGGTDSTGASGTNYGVHFTNARVTYNKDGPLITPASGFGFGISFAPGIQSSLPYPTLSFLAAGYGTGSDGTFSYLTGANPYQPIDAVFISGNGDPYCSSKADCDAKGYSWIDPMDMGGYIVGLTPDATNFGFSNVAYADDIAFGLSARPDRRRYPGDSASGDPSGEVPEPGILGLMTAGMLGLGFTRRRASPAY
jgi:hypothetical protein